VFLGKLEVFTAAVDGGYGWLAGLAGLAVANTVASLFYYLRWLAPAFLRTPGDARLRRCKPPAVPRPWVATRQESPRWRSGPRVVPSCRYSTHRSYAALVAAEPASRKHA
jgi:hypothetical protein